MNALDRLAGPSGIVTEISLPEEAAAGVHDYWSGKSVALAAAIVATRRARASGAVVWHAPVTPRTVFALQGLHALAGDEGVQLRWGEPAGLSERERAFFEDFLAYGPDSAAARGGIAPRVAELATAALEAAAALRNAVARTRRPRRADRTHARAVIIGAFGGDHIGDAAALGGILFELHQRCGLQRAWVMSHRPAHTRRLIAGLRGPVEVTVEDYRPGTADRLLDGADALVVGGGPMMDMPRVLAKHLAAAHAARVRGLPLLIERVGLGPFRRPISRWAVRRLAAMAERISVRASADALDPRLRGRDVEIGRDGAFEYLLRHTGLDAMGPAAAASLDRLLEGTQGRRCVAINLRPIYHVWSAQGRAYSVAAQDRFMADFGKALVAFAEQSDRPVTYVFYPMNAVQFGMSDLGSALRLHREVESAVDLRVWETDPDVDDVLELLRRVDLAVAMRYHAAIFALARGVPVLGIDYPGAGGKVERLFADLGRRDDVCRMDEFSVAWFVAAARRLLAQSAGAISESSGPADR